MNIKHTLFPASLLALAISQSASAEQTEEIIVTGELREIEQFDLANSVSVIDEELIRVQNARAISDVFNLAPNVNYAEGASRGRFIQIRGIGERSQFVNPINPSVGVLVDGIDFTGLSLGATTVDTKQIEVFRGPQGTQFGANALAGMLNVVGNAPGDEIEGKLSVGAGTYGRRDLGAVFSTPAGENFGWRIAAQKNESDGYIENAYLNREDTNNIDELSLRNHFTLNLGEHVAADLISYLIDVDNGYDAFSLDNNRTTLSDQPGHDRQETFAHALHMSFTGLDAFDLKTLVSVADSDVEYGYDEDWSFRTICAIDSDCAYWQYSTTDNYERENNNTTLDLRVLSKDNETFNWVAGVYYRQQQVDLLRTYTTNTGDFYSEPFNPERSYFDSEFNPTQYAIYGEIDIQLSDRLTTTIGVRSEQYESSYNDSDEIAIDHEEDLWGGKIALEFDINPSTMVYGLISRGYKPGGFNPDPDVPADALQYFTEWQLNYELGLKGQWFDNTLSAQLAYFYQTREDVQVNVSEAQTQTDFVIYLDNAAEGINQGIEAEINWRPIESLQFFSSIGLLDTEHTDFINPSHVDGEIDMSGRDQAHAPNYQYFVAAQYDLTPDLYFRVEFEGKDAFFFSESHEERSESYRLINASIGYKIQNVSLQLWGKNLTDELVETRGFYFSNDFGNDPRKFYAAEPYTQKGAPRTVGISASYAF